MQKNLAALLIIGCITALAGCSSSPILMREGNINVLATHGPATLQHLWGSPTVHASSLDGRDNEADLLNQTLASEGFNVEMNRKTQLITIREIFAGDPKHYQTTDEPSNPISGKMVAGVIGNAALCMLLNSCSNAEFLSNQVMDAVQDPTNEAPYTTKSDKAQRRLNAQLLVVNEACTFAGCVTAYSSTQDPAVTLNELRAANISVGIPVALHAKSP
ncbi:hypothetical protein WJ542_03365 [Paraburkholderia sp. B3]|uniref:hypothetical protein n=1 Tax=Paraburkholderia sp. B3 TaxID=3134791 RepID=UPI0039820E85